MKKATCKCFILFVASIMMTGFHGSARADGSISITDGPAEAHVHFKIIVSHTLAMQEDKNTTGNLVVEVSGGRSMVNIDNIQSSSRNSPAAQDGFISLVNQPRAWSILVRSPAEGYAGSHGEPLQRAILCSP